MHGFWQTVKQTLMRASCVLIKSSISGPGCDSWWICFDQGHHSVLPSSVHLFSSHKHRWCSWSCGRSCQTGCSQSYPALGPATRDRQTSRHRGMCNNHYSVHIAGIKAVELLKCAQSRNQMMNWIRFNKRCSFMVMRAWIWVSSVQRYLRTGGRRTALHSFPFSLSLSVFITLSLAISASLLLAFSLVISLTLTHPPPFFLSLSLFLLPLCLPLPFWELAQCQCLGSKVRQDWPGSLQRCPGVRHPHVVAAGTGRPLLSPGWRRGSELRCTVQNYKT